MSFLTESLQFRIHSLTIIVLCLYISLIDSVEFQSVIITAGLYFLTFAIAIIASNLTPQFRDINSNRSFDLVILLACWTGLNIVSFQTVFPEISQRNFPDPHTLLPILFSSGLVVITFLFLKSKGNLLTTSVMTLSMCMIFPYTRPLDSHPLGYVFPLFIGLHTIHRHLPGLKVLSKRKLLPALSTALFIFSVNLFHLDNYDYVTLVPCLLLSALFVVFFIIIALLTASSEQKTVQLLKTIIFFHVILLGTLTCIRAVWMTITLEFSSVLKYRLWLNLVHPNALALFLGISVFIIAPWRETGNFKRYSWLVTSLALGMLVMTQSRGAILALFITATILFLYHRQRSASISTGRFVLFITGFSTLMALILWRVRYRLLDSGMIDDRMMLWRSLRNYIPKASMTEILLGHGFQQRSAIGVSALKSGSHSAFLELWLTWDRLGQHFHNIFFELFWVSGIIGLLLGVLLVINVFKSQKKHFASDLKAAFAFTLLFGLVDCPVYYPAIFISVAFIPAYLLNIKAECSRKAAHTRQPVLTQSLIFLVLCLVLEITIIGGTARTHSFLSGGKHWSLLNYEKGTRLLVKAGTRSPISLEAVHLAAVTLMEKGQCADATELIHSHKAQSEKLASLGLWMDGVTEIGNWSDTWDSEKIIHRMIFDKDNALKWFNRLVLHDPETFEFFTGCLTSSNGCLTITEPCLIHWLYSQGIDPGDCFRTIPECTIDLNGAFQNLKVRMIERDNEYSDLERENLVKSLMIYRDYSTAVYLATRWDISLDEDMMQTDILTFRDGSAEYALKQAEKALNRGELQTAREHLSTAVDLKPISALWHRLNGQLHMKTHRWEEALKSLKRSESLDGQEIETQVSIGECYYYLQRNEEALVVFNQIIRVVPWSIKAHSYSGLIHLNNQRFVDAYHHLQVVADALPDSLWAQYNVYLCLRNLPGRWYDAENLRQAILGNFDINELPDDMKQQLEGASGVH